MRRFVTYRVEVFHFNEIEEALTVKAGVAPSPGIVEMVHIEVKPSWPLTSFSVTVTYKFAPTLGFNLNNTL